MNMLFFYSAIHGFTAVAMGAFGAHALKARLSPEALGWAETASRYQLVHAVAILALAAMVGRVQEKPLSRAAASFFVGTLIFAVSLYAMALGAPRWFGAITPIGGLGMLWGWVMVARLGWMGRKR